GWENVAGERVALRPQFTEVEPGTERWVGPGEHDRVHLGVAVELRHRLRQSTDEVTGERVAGLGTVERHDGDLVLHVDEQDVGHAVPSGIGWAAPQPRLQSWLGPVGQAPTQGLIS